MAESQAQAVPQSLKWRLLSCQESEPEGGARVADGSAQVHAGWCLPSTQRPGLTEVCELTTARPPSVHTLLLPLSGRVAKARPHPGPCWRRHHPTLSSCHQSYSSCRVANQMQGHAVISMHPQYPKHRLNPNTVPAGGPL